MGATAVCHLKFAVCQPLHDGIFVAKAVLAILRYLQGAFLRLRLGISGFGDLPHYAMRKDI